MRAEPCIAAGVALVVLAALPPLAPWLQSRLPLVVLGQYPLLVLGGALIGLRLARGRRAGWTAAPALAGAALAMAFWLVPRWIDAALADPTVGLARALCLWLLAGVPLGWGWAQAGPVLRGFALANAASMLAVMGWLQLAIPARLCNAYLLSDQRLLGIGFLAATAALVLSLSARAFVGRATRRNAPARA
ncbi:hypothetical protein [Phaeovulum sp. NW3]|uniref:hypothetical protein n=1 Tax=Phaeovulum sp. NW3 TaxID=2934933 RepID=UPI002021B2F5|nr:hypothetical protein [Phaeovulum sp. NW3]MCL7466564.1 hypothetical protein [Phaeovulum sp. NW3]